MVTSRVKCVFSAQTASTTLIDERGSPRERESLDFDLPLGYALLELTLCVANPVHAQWEAEREQLNQALEEDQTVTPEMKREALNLHDQREPAARINVIHTYPLGPDGISAFVEALKAKSLTLKGFTHP